MCYLECVRNVGDQQCDLYTCFDQTRGCGCTVSDSVIDDVCLDGRFLFTFGVAIVSSALFVELNCFFGVLSSWCCCIDLYGILRNVFVVYL